MGTLMVSEEVVAMERELRVISKRVMDGANAVLVTLCLSSDIWADSVHLVGDFDGRDQQSLPMTRQQDAWVLQLEQGKSFEFRYLVDGQGWIDDCRAHDDAPSPCERHNSAVRT